MKCRRLLVILVLLAASGLSAKTVQLHNPSIEVWIPDTLSKNSGPDDPGYSRTPLLSSYTRGALRSESNHFLMVAFFGADASVTAPDPMSGEEFVRLQPFTDISRVRPREFRWHGKPINGLEARYRRQKSHD
ncbi:MAG: hypothetical protein ACYTDT_12745 [Planctomycetota bacterium]|jgi:hypothetical protein